jgi:hypothetical protein
VYIDVVDSFSLLCSHNHLEDCIQQYNIDVQENEPEFGYYMSYIKTIDEVLKKKGLRYGN